MTTEEEQTLAEEGFDAGDQCGRCGCARRSQSRLCALSEVLQFFYSQAVAIASAAIARALESAIMRQTRHTFAP
jgi:hypothetical protein